MAVVGMNKPQLSYGKRNEGVVWMVEDVRWSARGVAGIRIKCAKLGQLEFRSAVPGRWSAGQPGALRVSSSLEIQLREVARRFPSG